VAFAKLHGSHLWAYQRRRRAADSRVT